MSDTHPQAAERDGDSSPEGSRFTARDPRTYLVWGALGVLAVLAVLATFTLYTSASAAIGLWVAPRYEPIFRAGFNLVVLLVVAAGISAVVGHLDATRG